MKSIRETEARGTDYVPSFDSPPTAMSKFIFKHEFHLFQKNPKQCFCIHVLVPVFCNQAVDEGRHQDLAEIGAHAEPETPTEGHELLRPTGDFHLVLLKLYIPTRIVQTLEKLVNQKLNNTLFSCPCIYPRS
jgi:hypothetical protein